MSMRVEFVNQDVRNPEPFLAEQQTTSGSLSIEIWFMIHLLQQYATASKFIKYAYSIPPSLSVRGNNDDYPDSIHGKQFDAFVWWFNEWVVYKLAV